MKSFEVYMISLSKLYLLIILFLVFLLLAFIIIVYILMVIINIEHWHFVVLMLTIPLLGLPASNLIEKKSREPIIVKISKKILTIDDRNIPLKEISHIKIKTLFNNFPFIRIFKKNGEIERIRVVKNANLLDLEIALNEIGLIKR